MKTARNHIELELLLTGQRVGFVPTMGALHAGHLSLVQASKNRGLFTVVSIFVNPTQFNDPMDFEKYPVDIEGDIIKLESVRCDVVYLPSKEEIYPPNSDQSKYLHDFGLLERVYEGAFRPGHFKGVGQVVQRLFELVKPDIAFFGEKDFQQLAVIRRLVQTLDLKIEIVGMPTMREADGLAMSSRNLRLTLEHRKKADLIYKALSYAKEHVQSEGADKVIKTIELWFEADPDFRLEYFDVINGETFKHLDSNADRAIIAAYLGEIRLIDNFALHD
ncbi:MAG: pantoate--beta-alanine ligase [Flavobacteriales bacterium]